VNGFFKVGVAAVAVMAGASACVYPGARPSGGSALTVTRVIDGDTVDMSNGQRVRLIGIDTPEAGTGSCANRATARLKQIVLGKQVKLTFGARDDKDKYGRLLRYVETAKYDAGRVLINEGLATARYDSRDGYGKHPREAKYVWADSVTPNCASSVTPPPPPPPSGGGGTDPRFPTCTAAKAAGYGPYYNGVDVEYPWYIDGDGDGIVCE
jgi:endonuclease YncB( thermonuclease family)